MNAEEKRRVLVTRPAADAAPLMAALAARGFDVLLEPMLTIRHLAGPELDLHGIAGILFTSANGVRAFAARSRRRDLTAYAVGEATGEAASAAGFARVHSAGGNVEDLAALIVGHAEPSTLVHAAGGAMAGDLSGLLEGAGFEVRREVLYEAEKSAALSDEAQKAIAAGEVDLVLFFSPRTAASFVSLAEAAGLQGAFDGIEAVCLSPAVAEAASGLDWRRTTVASAPDQASLLAALDD